MVTEMIEFSIRREASYTVVTFIIKFPQSSISKMGFVMPPASWPLVAPHHNPNRAAVAGLNERACVLQ